jgi:adenosylmethionine-8-amino-7-oxononanoate aminotransferase
VLRSLEVERWFARVRSLEESLRSIAEAAGDSVEALGALAGFTPPADPAAVSGAAGYLSRGVLVHGIRTAAGERCVIAPPFPIAAAELDELRAALDVTSPRGR